METDEPNWGILMGVDVTSRDGEETMGAGSVCDVTVAVLAGIGAIVMFFRPTFLSIVAAFPIWLSRSSLILSDLSVTMFWVMVPPLPRMTLGCISVMSSVVSVEGLFTLGSPSWSCCSFSRRMMHILL